VLLVFKNPTLRTRYESYLAAQKPDRRLLYPLLTLLALLSPYSLNGNGISGKFGLGFQVWTFLNCV
jgi:hypothetical protein